MTRDEIIAMAREAGLLPDNAHPAPETRAMRQRSEAVQIFATLVAEKEAAKEREACAKVCDEMGEHYSSLKDTALLNGDVELSNASSGEPRACEFLAAAIRARSNTTT